MRRFALALLVVLLVGCGDEDESGPDSASPPASNEVNQEAVDELRSRVVAGEFRPGGCEVTQFLDSREAIASRKETNKEVSQAGAPGHEVITASSGAVGVNAYKAPPECRERLRSALDSALAAP